MRRRALLTTAAGLAALAGCNAPAGSPPPRVYNPTGRATVRPLSDPLVRGGIGPDAQQYLHARLYRPGDSLPVTDAPDAEWYAGAVGDLSEGEFALLTGLRTAAAAPAHLWPSGTELVEGSLQVALERQSIDAEVEGAEAVGVALTVYEHDGDPPERVEVAFPGGATLSL